MVLAEPLGMGLVIAYDAAVTVAVQLLMHKQRNRRRRQRLKAEGYLKHYPDNTRDERPRNRFSLRQKKPTKKLSPIVGG